MSREHERAGRSRAGEPPALAPGRSGSQGWRPRSGCNGTGPDVITVQRLDGDATQAGALQVSYPDPVVPEGVGLPAAGGAGGPPAVEVLDQRELGGEDVGSLLQLRDYRRQSASAQMSFLRA